MALETRKPSLLSRAIRALLMWFYRRQGWTAFGEIPEPRRFIIIAAPHTSNWDFIYYIGLTQTLGIQTRFMAKTTLFRWPMRNFMLDMGGVPVDRKKGGNYVQAMIDEFANRKEFMLTIAPEGTRGAVREWKTGFYHIAMGANIPLVIGTMDYAKKTGGLVTMIWPTGDYQADMAKLAEIYAKVTPRHPGKKMASIAGENAE
ncbi:MAG: lysophospholipid acyltransferase family protein [Sphingomonadales bacterium]|nr:lysophospholipid acyltransferase family protein [Sphingomonadales bacterium]MBK9002926.1 lysophospholipid acyltransferase family protein [Sphingomonadales bacterium]MBK9268174.1 lysophospholipid acyltransferase family protein [Sphingomonadales bacterium]MBP6434275.1 lysophospholipid acyltransferase family protein [Sphingorhabdus sp.]